MIGAVEARRPRATPAEAGQLPPPALPFDVLYVATYKGIAMNIEQRALTDLKPYERNPRLNDAAVDAVAESIRQFGFRQPIVVDAEGIIICGHTRWRAATKLGLTEVPVHVAIDLTSEQIRAYRIADNKTNELAEWDMGLLVTELGDLKDTGIDWSLLGFDKSELANLLGGDGLTDPDDVPDPPADPITRLGDLWLCGGHRVLCGDSTKADDVGRLRLPDAVAIVADPPYGMRLAGGVV